MNDYMKRLMADRSQRADQLAADRALGQKRQPPAKLDYATIISAWWNTMPPKARQHPWSLEVIAVAAFAGQPRRPAMRRVAEALQVLSWIARRDWTRAGRNRRLWIPPTSV